MLSAFKKRFLGFCFTLAERSSSGEVISKAKLLPSSMEDPKRPLSIDSKQKQQCSKDKLEKTSKKIAKLEDFQYPHHAIDNRLSAQIISSCVSDFQSDCTNLLSGILSTEKSQKIDHTVRQQKQSTNIQECSTLVSNKFEAFHKEKIKYVRPREKIILSIQQQCAVCRNYVVSENSLKLACTHRCHHKCFSTMQRKYDLKCGICERRRKIVLKY